MGIKWPSLQLPISISSPISPLTDLFFSFLIRNLTFASLQTTTTRPLTTTTTSTIKATIIHHRMSMSREAAEIIRQRKIAIVTIKSNSTNIISEALPHQRQAASRSSRKPAAKPVHIVGRVAMARKSHGATRPAWTTSWQVAHFGRIIQVSEQQLPNFRL